MFQAVVDHCTRPAHRDAVAKLPGFAWWPGASRKPWTAWKTASAFPPTNPSTSAESKAALLDVLATEAAKLSGGVVTWAKVNGD